MLASHFAQLAIVGALCYRMQCSLLLGQPPAVTPFSGAAALLLGSHVRVLDDNGRCYPAYLGRVSGPMLSDVAVGDTWSSRSSAPG